MIRMKKVLFDLSVCQPIGKSKFHGGGVYGYIVFKKIATEYPNQVVAYYNFERFVDPEIEAIIKQNNVTSIDSSKISLEEAYNKTHSNRIYSPLYKPYYDSLIKEGIDFVLTIHGLRSLEMYTDKNEILYSSSLRDALKAYIKKTPLGKKQYNIYYNRYKNVLYAPNVRVITVSNHTKYSIRAFYPGVNINRVNVLYSPSTIPDCFPGIKKCSSCQKYYVVLSANRWLKNAYMAIQAFEYIFTNLSNFEGEVKIVGLNKNSRLFHKIKHKDRYEFLDYLSTEELETLYANAYALVYPTLNEGFGYPPIEAAKYGTPVITSPFSSITEICRDQVLYANPYDKYEIANRILQLDDNSIYSEYTNKAKSLAERVTAKQEEDLDELINILIDF